MQDRRYKRSPTYLQDDRYERRDDHHWRGHSHQISHRLFRRRPYALAAVAKALEQARGDQLLRLRELMMFIA